MTDYIKRLFCILSCQTVKGWL